MSVAPSPEHKDSYADLADVVRYAQGTHPIGLVKNGKQQSNRYQYPTALAGNVYKTQGLSFNMAVRGP